MSAGNEPGKGEGVVADAQDEGGIRALLPHAEKSLDIVSHLTEYQDEKANRIFTAMAFLSAFAGLLYAEISKDVPRLTVKAYGWGWWFHQLFLAYTVVLVLGALFVLLGIVPRFEIPATWKAKRQENAGGEPKSVLFANMIAEMDRKAWVNYFTRAPADVLKKYFDGYVFETHLVATKVRDKMKMLSPGVSMLWLSTCLLLAWVIVGSVARSQVTPQPGAATEGAQSMGSRNDGTPFGRPRKASEPQAPELQRSSSISSATSNSGASVATDPSLAGSAAHERAQDPNAKAK